MYYLQSRYYDPEIGRFIIADVYAATGQGLIGNNMFVYCLNNPIIYVDNCGNIADCPPIIENGLNLPASGGVPVVIDGTTYYYASKYENGALYEYWFDANGNLIWGRHNTDHRKPWKHTNPHDHQGGKDDDGNNTLINGPQPVDDKFQAPDQSVYYKENENVMGYVAVTVVAGVAVYQLAKWAIATIFAPVTGGASYVVAAIAP